MATITDKFQLTENLIKDIPSHIVGAMELLEETVDDEYLVEADFILCKVIFADQRYTFIHGFPGDNPSGIFYLNNELIAKVGECIEHETELQEWYYDVTNGLMDFGIFKLDH